MNEMGITNLENLEKLIAKVKTDVGYAGSAEVFINCHYELAITFSNEKGYAGYFLNFYTGEIRYSD